MKVTILSVKVRRPHSDSARLFVNAVHPSKLQEVVDGLQKVIDENRKEDTFLMYKILAIHTTRGYYKELLQYLKEVDDDGMYWVDSTFDFVGASACELEIDHINESLKWLDQDDNKFLLPCTWREKVTPLEARMMLLEKLGDSCIVRKLDHGN